MKPTITEIFYNGQRDVLNIINSGGPLVKYLSNIENPVCPLLRKDIKIKKKLGQGNFGVVFEIDFPDRGTRRYVGKRVNVEVPYIDLTGYSYADLEYQYEISAEEIMKYNGLDPRRTGRKDRIKGFIFIPTFLKECTLAKELTFHRVDGRGETVFFPGEDVCPMNYSEFAISVLVGELYRSGKCINFFDTFYFGTCPVQSKGLIHQYTFMERIDNSINGSVECLYEYKFKVKNPNYNSDVEEAINSIAIQLLYALYMIQGGAKPSFRIVHGDVHDGNTFLEYVVDDTPSKIIPRSPGSSFQDIPASESQGATRWAGRKVIDADYYKYKIEGRDIYVRGGKWCPFIVKLGDWGFACKYSSPKIANNDVILSGADEDGDPTRPNFYSEAYDVIVSMASMWGSNPNNIFLTSIVEFILDIPPGHLDTTQIKDLLSGKCLDGWTNYRPYIDLLTTDFAHISARNILMNDSIMGKYYSMFGGPGSTLLFGTDEIPRRGVLETIEEEPEST